MTLRSRIMLFVSLCFVVLVVGVSYAGLVREAMLVERFAETKVRSQQALWRHVSGTLAQSMDAPLETIASLPDLPRLIAGRAAAALSPLIQPVVSGLRQDGVALVEVFSAEGQLLYTSSAGAGLEERAVADAGVITRVADFGKGSSTVARDHDGRLLVVLMHPVTLGEGMAGGEGVVGVLVLGRSVDAALENIKADAGVEVYVTDLRYGAVQGTNARLWAQLEPELVRADTGAVLDLGAGGHVYNAVTRTISNSAGARLGYQITVEDITETASHLSLVHTLTALAAVVFGLGILALLSTYLARAFRPLSTAIAGLNALSRGDLSVEVEGRAQEDEVGRVAQAVRVFRDQQRAYRRQADSRARQGARQQRHIRSKMLSLAETLDPNAQAEVLRDLERIEKAGKETSGKKPPAPGATNGEAPRQGEALGDIAVAFDVMVQRVSDQHDRLDSLVTELRAALEAKNELANLQQQVEVAGRMQMTMLPDPLPPRSDIEVAGRLIQAREFGGTFYDYFPIGEGRMAVVVAEVVGSGLPAAFFTLTTRSLIRSVALFDLSPSECLQRVNDLLVGEGGAEDLSAHMVLGILDVTNGRISFSTAGTPQVFLMRRVGEVSAVPLVPAPLLGLTHGATFETRELTIPPRSSVIACSTGLVQATNAAGGEFSQVGLLATLRGLDDLAVDVVTTGVVEAVGAFTGGRPQAHDLTALALRFNGPQ